MITLKDQIDAPSGEGPSRREISRRIGRSKSVVDKCLKDLTLHGTKKPSGRPGALSERDQRYTVNMLPIKALVMFTFKENIDNTPHVVFELMRNQGNIIEYLNELFLITNWNFLWLYHHETTKNRTSMCISTLTSSFYFFDVFGVRTHLWR